MGDPLTPGPLPGALGNGDIPPEASSPADVDPEAGMGSQPALQPMAPETSPKASTKTSPKTRSECSGEAASIWASKPWWCQPWSILGTGVGVVAGSWWLLQRWWITLPLGLAVGLWWWLFLVAVPAAYRLQSEVASRERPGG